MKKAIVVSQPMFLPWAGMINQVMLSDIFVYYDDVIFPNSSSFINRVQIKTPNGITWLTVPTDKKRSEKKINKTYISYETKWQEKHIKTLHRFYKKTNYFSHLEKILEKIYSRDFETISDLNIYSFKVLLEYFNIEKPIYKSSQLNISGSSSKRLLDICKYFSGTTYITGHGAKNYLEHHLFEDNNIEVEYMNYKIKQYSQKFGEFTPYVSVLDLISNEGKNSLDFLNSNSLNWKTFLKEKDEQIR